MVDDPMCRSGLVSQQFHNRLRGSRRLREVTGVTMPRGRFTEGRLVELQTRVQQDKIMCNTKNNIQFYNRSAACRLTARRHQILQTAPFWRKKPGCSTNVLEAESGQLLYNKGENTVLNVMMFQVIYEGSGADELHVCVEPLPPGGAALGLSLDLVAGLPGRRLWLLLGPPLLPRYHNHTFNFQNQKQKHSYPSHCWSNLRMCITLFQH